MKRRRPLIWYGTARLTADLVSVGHLSQRPRSHGDTHCLDTARVKVWRWTPLCAGGTIWRIIWMSPLIVSSCDGFRVTHHRNVRGYIDVSNKKVISFLADILDPHTFAPRLLISAAAALLPFILLSQLRPLGLGSKGRRAQQTLTV
jgi:hypothetical protein